MQRRAQYAFRGEKGSMGPEMTLAIVVWFAALLTSIAAFLLSIGVSIWMWRARKRERFLLVVSPGILAFLGTLVSFSALLRLSAG